MTKPQMPIQDYDIVTWNELNPGDQVMFCTKSCILPGEPNQIGVVSAIQTVNPVRFITINNKMNTKETFKLHELQQMYWWRSLLTK